MVARLRGSPALSAALIGRVSLYVDPAAYLADLRSVDTLLDFRHLTDEVVLASPRLALVGTFASQDLWIEGLTAAAGRDEASAVEALRNRPSEGGRVWARPACVLPALASTTEARFGILPLHPTLVLQVKGPWGHRPEDAFRQLLSRAAERAGMGWHEVSADVILTPGSWQHRLDHRGGLSGAIALALSTPAELDDAAAVFEDAVVVMADAPRLVSVSQLLPQGNRRRGAGPPSRR